MTPHAITLIVSDRLVSALCNTLVHSLWQGVLLAAAAGLIVIFTRKASPAFRYNLLILSLLTFAVAVAATFSWQYRRMGGETTTGSAAHAVLNNVAVDARPVHFFRFTNKQSGNDIISRLNGYLVNYHDMIVLIWFLVICARSLQLSFGLYGAYRLRRVKVYPAGDKWANLLRQLSERLHVKQAVTLLESGLAKVPMVIGHLKPVVLVPVGLLASLSQDEMEAILIHELAHIRRRDYLVNMLQSLMEIIFFFNPAVLWVSKLLKTERENCCDDLVVAQNNDKMSYIRALVSCEEFQAAVPACAMAFPGSKNTLLDRVKRMASNRNHSLNLFEKTALAICLVVFGFGVSAFSARGHVNKALHAIVTAIHHPQRPNNVGGSKIAVSQRASGNQTVRPTVSAQQIQTPASNTLTTGALGNGSNTTGGAALIAATPAVVYSKSKTDTTVFQKFHAIGRELYNRGLVADTSNLSISLDEKKMVVNGVRMPDNLRDEMYHKYGLVGTSGTYTGHYTNVKGEGNAYAAGAYAGNNSYGNSVMLNSDSAHGANAFAYSGSSGSYSGSGRDYQAAANASRKEYEEKQKQIVKDLLQDGLITDADHFSFTLSSKSFKVNGKKQSGEVYEKYKKKYMPVLKNDDGWSWSCSKNGDNAGNTVSVD